MPQRVPSWECVEALEPRMLLATISWDGGGGTDDWHNPLNWSGDVLPGPADDVLIDVPPANAQVTHSIGATTIRSLRSKEALSLAGGTLFVLQPSRIEDGSLTVAGGTLRIGQEVRITDRGTGSMAEGRIDGPGLFLITAPFTWSGGTIAGSGKVKVDSAGALTIDAESATLERVLENRTHVVWSGRLLHLAGGVIRNLSSGTFTVRHEIGGQWGQITGANAASRVENYGRLVSDEAQQLGLAIRGSDILAKSTMMPGSTVVSVRGVLGFGGGVFRGRFDLHKNTGVRFTGVGSFTTEASFAAENSGSFVRFDEGSHTIRFGQVWNGIIVIIAGEAVVNVAANSQFSNIILSSGLLTGSGQISVTDRLSWNSGTLAGSGRITIAAPTAPGSGMLIANSVSNQKFYLKKSVSTYGTVWLSRTVSMYGVELSVMAGGKLTSHLGNIRLFNASGQSVVRNAGEMREFGNVYLDGVRLLNSGSLKINHNWLGIRGAGDMLVNSGKIEFWDGTIKIWGNYLQESGGTIYNLFSAARPYNLARSGRLIATGRATLAGRLEVRYPNNLEAIPDVGYTARLVITNSRIGTFGSFHAWRLPAGQTVPVYGPQGVALQVIP